MVQAVDILPQSQVWANRYLLNRDTISSTQYDDLISDSHDLLGLVRVDRPCYTKGDPVPLCDWINKNITVEPHTYDFIIPVGHTTPVSFFATDKPWVMLLYVYDGYATLPQSSLNRPEYVSRAFALKDDIYMPKSTRLEDVEVSWVGWDDLPDCILIHHNQIHGVLKGYLSKNELLWMYRYMIRTTIQRIPRSRWHHIFVPDSTTFALFMERKMKYTQVPMMPYTHHVMQKSDFEKVGWDVFSQVCPSSADICDMINYLEPHEINFWRYEHDNNGTLANTCNGAG